VGLAGAPVGGRGTVAVQHGTGAPAGQAHEVGLAAALGEPPMGEGVAELVGMQPGKARLLGTMPQHLDEAPRGEPPAEAKPQPEKCGVLVTGTDPQVPVERTAVLRPTAARARDGLAKHQQDVQVEVEVGHPGTQQLGAAGSHVDQQRDQRQALQRVESGR
jgi:hypothetical protein